MLWREREGGGREKGLDLSRTLRLGEKRPVANQRPVTEGWRGWWTHSGALVYIGVYTHKRIMSTTSVTFLQSCVLYVVVGITPQSTNESGSE